MGGELTSAEILRAVRSDAEFPGPECEPPADAGSADSLTPREHEVALLVAQGLSDREVAERLVISKRTADTHVERILAELKVASRTRIGPALEP